MIRDPSDGSIREPTGGESQKSALVAAKPPVTSSLPFTSTKPENLARLEKSREWILNYHRDKGA